MENHKICVAFISSDIADFKNDIGKLEDYVGKTTELKGNILLELRLDYLEDHSELEQMIKRAQKNNFLIIATYRPKSESDKFAEDGTGRLALLRKAIDIGVNYVDIEHDSFENKEDFDKFKEFANKQTTKVIVSRHLDNTPEDIGKIYNDLKNFGADIVKLVTTANNILDNFKVFELLLGSDYKTIAFCMGEEGKVSRILCPKFGSKITYASMGKGKESASGQIPIKELIETYRVHTINSETEIFGLLGDPVEQSKGIYIHNAAFAKENVNAVYVLLKVDKEKETDLNNFMGDAKKIGIKGLSVTIPYKERIKRFLDDFESISKRVGTFNTVINQKDRIKGYNTDIKAAIESLESFILEKLDKNEIDKVIWYKGAENTDLVLRGKKIVIYGAGGAGRAIAFGLKEKDAEIFVVNRNSKRAEELSKDVDCHFIENIIDIEDIHEIDIFINATEVGMFSKDNANFRHESPLKYHNVLKNCKVVYDIIYNPEETKLLQEAEKRECLTLNGVDMFIRQAGEQFKLFTGKEAPAELMKETFEKHINNKH